jgi:hypothetical protein
MTRVLVVSAVLLVSALGAADAAAPRKGGKGGDGAAPATKPAPAGSLSIRGVVQKDGKPVAGVEVRIANSDHEPATTDEAGRFSLDGLAPGTYTLVAGGKKEKGVSKTTVLLERGKSANVVVVVRPERPRGRRGGGGVVTPK